MSLGSDCIPEIDIDESVRYLEVENEANKGFWTTKNGTIIHVTDMTDDHIRNTINYIKRIDKIDLYLPWIHTFEKELERRYGKEGNY